MSTTTVQLVFLLNAAFFYDSFWKEQHGPDISCKKRQSTSLLTLTSPQLTECTIMNDEGIYPSVLFRCEVVASDTGGGASGGCQIDVVAATATHNLDDAVVWYIRPTYGSLINNATTILCILLHCQFQTHGTVHFQPCAVDD
jgi:hypothetical protein